MHGLIRIVIFFITVWYVHTEISSGRIKGDDEPHMVSWHVLEGITEPFESEQHQDIPAWKQMKNSADQKAAGQMIQLALHEYGQILRHPYMFGEMPMTERYDIFLSMSKLLKIMGFYQRAELLLYEAMSYTTNPFEAHLQLGLLFLDKEDLEKAKMHFKNCLFFQENDVHILVHLSVILISEGKLYEAKYFLSRIISGLEARVNKLSFLLHDKQLSDISKDAVNYKVLSNWLEELIVKVFYGEFRITPSSTFDMLKMFSNLYAWLTAGEMSGRFIFDLGQSLYEGGRPRVGQLMMKRGHETSNDETEGSVSFEVVRTRLALDYPVVPDSLLEIVESYFNMTLFLSNSSSHYNTIDIENIMDMYWSLPLLVFSGLPVMPVVKELLWRFNSTASMDIAAAATAAENRGLLEWFHASKELELLSRHNISQFKPFDEQLNLMKRGYAEGKEQEEEDEVDCEDEENEDREECSEQAVAAAAAIKKTKPDSAPVDPYDTLDRLPVKIEVGILGGHMNNHPVGQMTLWRILKILNGPGWRDMVTLTLLALPLMADSTTKQIASRVDRIVNLPLDVAEAHSLVMRLQLDVLLFPDWQPFPDQQSLVLLSQRLAPVQVCFFVLGGSCVSSSVDYYLLPEELAPSYLRAVPAADSLSTMDVRTGVVTSNSSVSVGKRQQGSSGGSSNRRRRVRPLWREMYVEQVVLLDWPVLTPELVVEMTNNVVNQEMAAQRHAAAQATKTGAGASGGSSEATESIESSMHTMMFNPLEIEGRVFFEGQPVAVLALDPTHIHPLMDNLLFKIMRAIPALHVIVALPESFMAHVQDNKHKISWARKLVRRLWARGGNLFHRIRLLPAPLSDHRLLQLLRQTDMVLDSFPRGGSFHLLSLALSVGTPVLALENGVTLHSTKEDLRDIRTFVQQSMQQQSTHQQQQQPKTSLGASSPSGENVTRSDLFKTNPLTQLLLQSDHQVPWTPSSSSLCGFYERAGLSQYFLANSTAAYYHLAVKLALNREYAYGLRVKLLEIVDKVAGKGTSIPPTTPVNSTGSDSSASAAAGTVDEETERDEGQCRGGKGCQDDFGRFIVTVGAPYAKFRVRHYGNITLTNRLAKEEQEQSKRTGKKRLKASAKELNDSYKIYFDTAGFGIVK